jgi:Flp pilus assembly protein TadD
MGEMTVLEALQLAVEHYHAGRFEQAVVICRDIVSHDPNQADAFGLLGLMAFQMGQMTPARDLVSRAIELQPRHAKFHYDLGMILSSLRLDGDAITSFRRAIELRPNFPEALNNLGTVLKRRLQFDDAISAYNRAVALMPGFAEAYYNLGNCWMKRSRRFARRLQPSPISPKRSAISARL